MKRPGFVICAVILLVVCGSAFAAQDTFEFHHDARMQIESGSALENAYGYVYVATDMKGHGVIRVMFSNGTRLAYARFNAQVKFLDADGGLIREERFSQLLDAADVNGAAEQRLSRLVDLSEFESMEVALFLSEVPGLNGVMQPAETNYRRTLYSGTQ